MTSKDKPTIGITFGDPAGIGPEVIAKSLLKPAIRNSAQFKIIKMIDKIHENVNFTISRSV